MGAPVKKVAKWVVGWTPEIDEAGTTVSTSSWFKERKQKPSTVVRFFPFLCVCSSRLSLTKTAASPPQVKDYFLSLFPFLQWLPNYNLQWAIGDCQSFPIPEKRLFDD